MPSFVHLTQRGELGMHFFERWEGRWREDPFRAVGEIQRIPRQVEWIYRFPNPV